MLRRTRALFLLAGFAALVSARARAAAPAPAAPSNYDRVEVAPAKTSIYIGTVAMTMPAFERHGERYDTTYTAKVFPYFFYNEKGTLSVDISAAQLRALARGEPIEFTGRAVRDDGAERRVEGKATPADAASGKLKVRVFVSKRVELIFNTTYRFVR